MQLQDQPLPQPPNTIHNVASAPFQAITFGDALLPCSSSMHRFIHLITFKPVYWAHKQLKPRHARDWSPLFCTLRSLTLFDSAKFLVDTLDFSHVSICEIIWHFRAMYVFISILLFAWTCFWWGPWCMLPERSRESLPAMLIKPPGMSNLTDLDGQAALL